VHLAWATTTSPELAIIDALGRVAILTFSIALNRPFSVRRWEADLVDDLHAVVGAYWLSLVPQGRQVSPAVSY
jgi:mediator of RNA polymerase II transcription subunit 16, fungi type